MTERTIDQIVAECERWWRSTGVPSDTVAEMKVELRSHLSEAQREAIRLRYLELLRSVTLVVHGLSTPRGAAPS